MKIRLCHRSSKRVKREISKCRICVQLSSVLPKSLILSAVCRFLHMFVSETTFLYSLSLKQCLYKIMNAATIGCARLVYSIHSGYCIFRCLPYNKAPAAPKAASTASAIRMLILLSSPVCAAVSAFARISNPHPAFPSV